MNDPRQLRMAPRVTPAVMALLIINVAAYLLKVISNPSMIVLFGLYPPQIIESKTYWQFITYLFMHGSPTHLLFNMLVLWMFGGEVEMVLGQARFHVFYLLCGVGAGILTAFFAQDLVIGSSGAIFGLMAAYGLLFPNRTVLFMLLFPLKVKYMVVISAPLNCC